MEIDQGKLDSLMAVAVGDLSAGYGGVMISIGDKLGLYKAMAGAGPLTASELAKRSGCAERYLREWLNAQAAGGYVAYHPSSEAYELTPEQALVLADETRPARSSYRPPGRCRRRCGSMSPLPSRHFVPGRASPGAITIRVCTRA